MVYNERLKREIPIGWEVENLIDFAEIKNGATPSTADEANYGGDIVWITPKDLSDQQSKFVYQGERNITKQGFDSCSTSMLPTNSVLMSSRAPIGLVSIAKHEVCTNQGFKSFIPKSISDSIYLYYYINHHIKQIEQLGTGTTFKEVSRDDLCKFPILTIGAKNIYVQWIELQNGIADKQLALTKEIAAENGLKVDEVGFKIAMQEQKDRAKAATAKISVTGDIKYAKVEEQVGSTEFVGYDLTECNAEVLALIDGDGYIDVVLDKTPFYAECGGQVGDSGFLSNEEE